MFVCRNALKHFTVISLMLKDGSNEFKFTLFFCQRVYISLQFISVVSKFLAQDNDFPAF